MLKGVGLAVWAAVFCAAGCSEDPVASGRGFTCVDGSTEDGDLCSCRLENPSDLPEVEACPAEYPCCLELASATEGQCACFSQEYLDYQGANDPEGPREFGCEDEAAAKLSGGWKTAEIASSCASG